LSVAPGLLRWSVVVNPSPGVGRAKKSGSASAAESSNIDPGHGADNLSGTALVACGQNRVELSVFCGAIGAAPRMLSKCHSNRENSAMDIMEQIREQVEQNRILLYMKGSPNQPQCGFSARVVQALMACGQRFAYVDVLSNPDIRANLPKYAQWPTFPQLWVNGELVGGCDIVCDMHEKGELEPLIQEAAEAADQG
jgi:monothiol glutaredoxin